MPYFLERLHQGGNNWTDETWWREYYRILCGVCKFKCKFSQVVYSDIYLPVYYWFSAFCQFNSIGSLTVVTLALLQKVENKVRALSDLRELASAESVDTFTLIYTNLLQHQPDCPVNNHEHSCCAGYSFNLML